ncbi:MAG: 50S ribosomal protein L23 [Candidatus Sericytochromatia bacterium]
MDPYSIVKYPLVTEKSTQLGAENQYVFEVDTRANKVQIAKAVASIFKVEVDKVCTINLKAEKRAYGSRARKHKARKKAIVTLKQGHQIDLAM